MICVVVEARRRYLQNPDANGNEVDSIIGPLDNLIRIMDGVESSRPRRGWQRSLDRPRNNPFPRAPTSIWPPCYFRPLDIVVLGEQSVREKLYGVNCHFSAVEEFKPQYPTDQSGPIDARRYLSWLALATQKQSSKISLFLTPVAFMTHEERQEWYENTGHKSRYYATINDFVEYAKHEIGRSSTGYSKDHVLALVTPWFFDIEQVKIEAEKRNIDIPAAWKLVCFRAGLAFCLSKAKWVRNSYKYRLLIFRPRLPTYSAAAEQAERRTKQDEWISGVISIIKTDFNIDDTWLDGRAEQHQQPNRRLGKEADSVEASAEFIAEIMEEKRKIPDEDEELIARDFRIVEAE